jgi:MOSC domain-containing protein YiiM
VTELPFAYDVEVVLLLASPQHRYEGRPSDGPRDATSRELHDSIELRAGLGIVGDRYFGQRAHVTASVTVFAAESLDHVSASLGLTVRLDPAGPRRNIVLRGIDVDALRGTEFTIGDVRLRAHRPANPCAWMDVALAPGAFRALRGRGGIRCEVLTNGTLALGPAVVRTSVQVGQPALF